MDGQLTAGLGKGQPARLIENDEVQPGHVIGEAPLLCAPGPGPEAVHEVDDIAEAASGAVADAFGCQNSRHRMQHARKTMIGIHSIYPRARLPPAHRAHTVSQLHAGPAQGRGDRGPIGQRQRTSRAGSNLAPPGHSPRRFPDDWSPAVDPDCPGPKPPEATTSSQCSLRATRSPPRRRSFTSTDA